jgi:hypothetical protein
MPFLQEHGQYPIEALSRPTLEAYLNGLTHLAYTTHQRHKELLLSVERRAYTFINWTVQSLSASCLEARLVVLFTGSLPWFHYKK